MKTHEIEKEMMDALMYSEMDEPDFWATSTISPQEALMVARAWELIHKMRIKSESKQKEFSKKFAVYTETEDKDDRSRN